MTEQDVLMEAARYDGYIRVSRVAGRAGPGYISPDVQRDSIQRWADFRRIKIVAWHVDEDESGGTQNRPGLREAIRRIEAGETNGLACWRLNRFARNVGEAVQDVQRIQDAGAQLAFIEEGIDPTGPFGQFLLTILLAVATLERDNLAAGFEEAKRRATARGAYVSRTPYGYERQEDGTLAPHPVEAEHVRRAFELAAKQSIQAAHAYLLAEAAGRTWTVSTVRRMLAKRSYLGEIHLGDAINLEGLPALVSPAIWQAAQRDGALPRKPPAKSPLSGLATCGTCGAALVGSRSSQRKGPPVRTYRCAATQSLHRGERCPKPANIMAERLESYVRDRVIQLAHGLRVEVGDADQDALVEAERAVSEAEAELDAFAADMTLRRALGHRYHEHLQSRVEAVEEARRQYGKLVRHTEAVDVLTGSELIEDADMAELGELLRGVFRTIVVAPGRGNVAGRVRFVSIDADGASGATTLPRG